MDDYFETPLTKGAERYFEKIQSLLKYCIGCQPYDGGEYIWIIGEKINLEELLEDRRVPAKYREEICSHLICPNCGSSSFDESSEIGLEDRFDAEVLSHLAKAEKKYKFVIEEFGTFLEAHQLLALKHNLGYRIFKEIGNRKFPKCAIEGKYFRSRLVSDSSVLETSELFAAPKGIPLEGRFNHSGQSHLYISKDKETSIKESLRDLEISNLVWVQELQIENTDNLLDLTLNWDDMGLTASTLLVALHSLQALEKNKENHLNWKPNYLVTRFIMDCAKYFGYNGIKYFSTKEYKGENVVLFYPENLRFDFSGRPYVYIHQGEKRDINFLDYPF